MTQATTTTRPPVASQLAARPAGSPLTSDTLGDWVLVASGALAFVAAVYDYFAGPGIAGTPGVVLVIISTALIAMAGIVIAENWAARPWEHGTLVVLLLLGLTGTLLAAYFLEATLLIVLMIVGLIGWIAGRLPSVPLASPDTPRRAAT